MAAIEVAGVGKKYRQYHDSRPTTFTEVLRGGLRQLRPSTVYWALRNVSFSVGDGMMLGIIGNNGAGKSTLLRLIGGIGRQDEGTIVTEGRIGAILDLGAGFHPDLTGRENVYVTGVIGGLSRQEVKDRFDEIVSFAEAEAYIDNPLRTYSSGMQMRLAFSVATHIDPQILLIDEVLSVGDLAFQKKSLDRIYHFKNNGRTIVLVSHDIQQVEALCDQVLWLRDGEVAALGESQVVVGQYRAEARAETRRLTPKTAPPALTPQGVTLRPNENRFGSLEMQISTVQLLDQHSQLTTQLDSSQPLTVAISLDTEHTLPAPHVSITITREDGFICYDSSSDASSARLPEVQGPLNLRIVLERLDLVPGDYFVDVGIFPQDWSYAYDYHWHAYPLRICGPGGQKGILATPLLWEVV